MNRPAARSTSTRKLARHARAEGRGSLRFSPNLFILTYMLCLKFVVGSAYCTYLVGLCPLGYIIYAAALGTSYQYVTQVCLQPPLLS